MLLIISIIEVKLYGIQYQPIGSDPDKADKKNKSAWQTKQIYICSSKEYTIS